jgi:hypothetical protein
MPFRARDWRVDQIHEPLVFPFNCLEYLDNIHTRDVPLLQHFMKFRNDSFDQSRLVPQELLNVLQKLAVIHRLNTKYWFKRLCHLVRGQLIMQLCVVTSKIFDSLDNYFCGLGRAKTLHDLRKRSLAKLQSLLQSTGLFVSISFE